MTFAGVFAESDPYETGNLVGRDGEIPPELDESRVSVLFALAHRSASADTFWQSSSCRIQSRVHLRFGDLPRQRDVGSAARTCSARPTVAQF